MGSAGIWTNIAEHPTSFAVTDLDASEDGSEVAVVVAAELLPQAVSESIFSEADCTAWLDTDRWVQHDWRAGLWSGGAHHCMRESGWQHMPPRTWEALQQLTVCAARWAHAGNVFRFLPRCRLQPGPTGNTNAGRLSTVCCRGCREAGYCGSMISWKPLLHN